MIDGKLIASKIISELKQLPTPKKTMAAILVGDDTYSRSFLKQKAKTAYALGITFELHELAETLTQEEVEKAVWRIAKPRVVGGVIVQLPLPKQYDRELILAQIPLQKDVDDLNGMTRGILPPAPGSLKRIFQELNFQPKGKRAVVIGPGFLIGKPIASWLIGKVSKLTVWGRGQFDEVALKEADLIVTSAGVPKLIRGEHIKERVIMVDYGYATGEDGTLVGDIDLETCSKKTHYITPTPGGTGPIVVAQLFENFYALNR